MAIQWTEDLATGSQELDDQHREIFRRISGLLDACNEGKGRQEVGRVIGFLDDYIVTHFGLEEQYMLEQGYPDFQEHKRQHEEFIQNFLVLKKQVMTNGPGLSTVIGTNQLVVRWFMNHIRKVDTDLGAYLKTRQQ